MADEEFPKDEKNNDSSKIHQGTKTERIPYPAGPIITIKKTRSMKLLATRDTAWKMMLIICKQRTDLTKWVLCYSRWLYDQ